MKSHKNRFKKVTDTSWNKVAGWYDKHVSNTSDFHDEIIHPGVIKLLAPKRTDVIVDIGCGQGELCRELSEMCHSVVGIDSAKKLIDIARSKTENDNVSYKFLNASKLAGMQSSEFDSAVSVLALQNMEELPKVLSEASRVLKKNGKFVIVMNHPCFRIPRQSGWEFDEDRKLQFRRIDRYMTPLKIPIQMHPGSSPDLLTWTFHRPLSVYMTELASAGFKLIMLEEWVSNRKSKPGGISAAENSARAEIPMFLALSCENI